MGFSGPAFAYEWMNEASLAPGAFSNTTENAMTYRLLETESHDQRYLDQGKSRAKEMVRLIQEKELKIRAVQLTPVAKRIQEHEYIAGPSKVIGAGAVLWFGKRFNLVSSADFRLDTRVEARARMASVLVDSIAFNTAVEMRPSGMTVGLNRKIPVIESFAELHYNIAEQCLRTWISKALLENVVLTVGASDTVAITEGNAQISYSVAL